LLSGNESSRVDPPQFDEHASSGKVRLGCPETNIIQRAVSRFGG